MALTTERIKELWDAYRAALPRYLGFAKAIEAEVRKQDDALILQLVEALENSHATLYGKKMTTQSAQLMPPSQQAERGWRASHEQG